MTPAEGSSSLRQGSGRPAPPDCRADGEAARRAGRATRNSASAREPVVAFVEHHYSDRVHLMVGEREIVVHDKDLAARILNAAGGR